MAESLAPPLPSYAPSPFAGATATAEATPSIPRLEPYTPPLAPVPPWHGVERARPEEPPSLLERLGGRLRSQYGLQGTETQRAIGALGQTYAGATEALEPITSRVHAVTAPVVEAVTGAQEDIFARLGGGYVDPEAARLARERNQAYLDLLRGRAGLRETGRALTAVQEQRPLQTQILGEAAVLAPIPGFGIGKSSELVGQAARQAGRTALRTAEQRVPIVAKVQLQRAGVKAVAGAAEGPEERLVLRGAFDIPRDEGAILSKMPVFKSGPRAIARAEMEERQVIYRILKDNADDPMEALDALSDRMRLWNTEAEIRGAGPMGNRFAKTVERLPEAQGMPGPLVGARANLLERWLSGARIEPEQRFLGAPEPTFATERELGGITETQGRMGIGAGQQPVETAGPMFAKPTPEAPPARPSIPEQVAEATVPPIARPGAADAEQAVRQSQTGQLFRAILYRGESDLGPSFGPGVTPDRGRFFTPDPVTAQGFAGLGGGARMVREDITLRNPLVATNRTEASKTLGVTTEHITDIRRVDELLAQAARAKGYDGIIYPPLNEVQHLGPIPSTIPEQPIRGLPPRQPPTPPAPPRQPPTGGGVPPATPPEDTVAKLVRVIKAAKPARAQTEALKSQELRRRVGAATGTYESLRAQGVPVEEALARSTGQLRGELPKAVFEMAEEFTTDEIAGLFNRIEDANLRYFSSVNTSEALRTVLTGAIPTEGQLTLLEKVFGPELVSALVSKQARGKGYWASEVLNLPRTLMASFFDFSGTLRQAAVSTEAHPIAGQRQFVKQVKAFFREDLSNAYRRAILDDPDFDLYLEKGGYITGAKLTAREEAFMSSLAGRIPIIGQMVKRASRAMSTYLDGMRFEQFKIWKGNWEKAGLDIDDPYFNNLVSFGNHTTGRGDLPGVARQAGGLLNGVFFAPRLVLSRVQIPLDVLRAGPGAVRGNPAARQAFKEMAKDVAIFTATGVGVLTALKMSGAADVEVDPRSTDFGKIKIGPTRLDFWGGFQPIARYTAQILTGQRKTTGSGNLIGIDRWETLGRFIQGKLSPPVALGVDVLRGETFTGEELTASGATVARQMYNRLTPLFAQDLTEAMQQYGIKGGLLATAGLLGIGVQSYRSVGEVQDQMASALFGGQQSSATGKLYSRDVRYRDLNSGEQDQVDRTPQVQKAITPAQERKGPSAQEQVPILFQQFDRRKAEIETDFRRDFLDKGLTGESLRKGIQDLKSARFQAGQAVLGGPQMQAYLDRNADKKPLEDQLRDAYWSAEAPLVNGRPDFAARDAMRAQVLAEAQRAGVSTSYITTRDYEKLYTDPKVRATIKEYDADQETIRKSGYWDIADEVVQAFLREQNAPNPNVTYDQFYSEIIAAASAYVEQQGVQGPQIKAEAERLATKWFVEQNITREITRGHVYMLVNNIELLELMLRWEYNIPLQSVKEEMRSTRLADSGEKQQQGQPAGVR